MRILSVVRKNYYGNENAVEPMCLYFTVPLRALGHNVETFDHYRTNSLVGKTRCTELLIDKIRFGSFDLVLYQTSGAEPVDTSELGRLTEQNCIVAWNSDDDWQWSITGRITRHFSFVITTYPHIYQQNVHAHPNLLLSQWGCLGIYSDHSRSKDIGFSFAGAVYGNRNAACRFLRRNISLLCYGRGSRLVKLGIPYFPGAFRLPWLAGGPIDFKQINDIWNRSRISYTPMSGGSDGSVLSIKSRAFDMGLSGTLMLCEQSRNLERYYEPGRECVTFSTLEECVEKAGWFLTHEVELRRIAKNYYDRTMGEHLWTHRFNELFTRIGM